MQFFTKFTTLTVNSDSLLSHIVTSFIYLVKYLFIEHVTPTTYLLETLL